MKQTQRMMGWAAGALLTCIVSFIAPGCGDGDSPNTVQPITGGNAGTAGGTGGANSGGSSGKGGSSGQGGSSGTGGVGGSSGTGGSSAGGTGGANVGGQDAGGSGGADADAGGTGGNDPDGGDADTGTGGNVDSGTGGASGDAGTGGSASDSGTGGTGGTIVVPCPANCSGHGTCNDQNGVCSCATGFDGAGCDQCASGYKNYPECYLIKTCPADCSGHGSCDDKTGQCSCATGFTGTACDSCASGYKSYPTCYAIQTCPANCSGHGTCNDQTGQCACNTGFDTANCGACASGYSGYPNCQIPPQPFTCANYARNSAFDSFMIDGIHAWLVGGIWGTSASNVYVTAATYDKGTVAHWNGNAWTNESLPIAPYIIGNIWGSSTDDVWVPGMTDAQVGVLFHRTNNSWTQDPNQPSAWEFDGIWGANANDVFLTGRGGSFPPKPKAWRKNGNGWTETPLPSVTGDVQYYVPWGLDAGNVYLPGKNDVDKDGTFDKGVLLVYNGTSWSTAQVPTGCRDLRSIHGTSLNDLWVAGITTSGKGVVYHVTNNLATWTPYVNQSLYGYAPIFSVRAGTAVAIGGVEPLQAGNLRVTTFDQVNQPLTATPDSKAYGPGVAVWYDQVNHKAWYVSISDNGQQNPSGVYTADCN